MSSTPIADHALLSDCHCAALVTRHGSVDWLCFPRFDSPSVFARLLDDAAGHWSIRPVGDFEATRRYLDNTMVLETTFTTDTGSVTLVDGLAMGANERVHDIGGGAPSLLIRRIEGMAGQVEIQVEYVPRTEYGLIHPLLSRTEGGVAGRGGADLTMLTSPVELVLGTGSASGRFVVAAGEGVAFALHYGQPGREPPRVWSQDELARRLDDTISAWRSWSELHQSYEGPWHELVHTSGRVLQALTYYPTGSIVAAATTSLPEAVAGNRNWDYRYSWVRDACLTMDALWVAACPDEAEKFFAYLSSAAAISLERGADLQIMFSILGERNLSEHPVPVLPGLAEAGLGGDDAGADDIDPDALSGQFPGQAAGHRFQGRFARRKMDPVPRGSGVDGIRRGERDDATPVTAVLCGQPPRRFAGAQESAENVGAENIFKFAGGQLGQRTGRPGPDGVVNEAAQRAEGGIRGRKGLRHVIFAANVRPDCDRLAASGLDLADDPRGIAGPGAVDQRDRPAGPGRPKRDLGTDTAATAGHDQGPRARLKPGCCGHGAS